MYKCKDCGSQRITWNIDSGYVLQEYSDEGVIIENDFHCDSLNSPQCAMCDSTDLEGIVKQ